MAYGSFIDMGCVRGVGSSRGITKVVKIGYSCGVVQQSIFSIGM